jgi:hypothetical protein
VQANADGSATLTVENSSDQPATLDSIQLTHQAVPSPNGGSK